MYTWGYVKEASLAKLDLDENEATAQNLLSRFPFYANEVITQICSSIKPKHTFVEFVIDKSNIAVVQKMPDDFVAFGDDICYELIEDGVHHVIKSTITDDDFEYVGYNEVIFKRPGHFFISYSARWYTFDKDIANDVILDIPADIVDCIPSYIASQCYKIDDEYKASVFRNEYEMFLARIDDTDYKQTKTFHIGGNW